MECPHDQENKVHYLHFAEVVAALQILDMGGTFVLKMFTFFELTTVGLLYFLNNVFDKVDVFKPAASKQGNSEVYVICSGFQRIYKNLSYLLDMTAQMKHNDVPMFALDTIPDDFIDQVNSCAGMFMVFQTKAIESNIYHFHRPDIDDQQEIHELRYGIRREYVRLYGVRPIVDRLKIMHGEPCTEKNVCAPMVTFNGSFTSRLIFKKLTKEEKTLELRSQLQSIEKRISFQSRWETVTLSMDNQYNDTLKAFYGQPIRHIVSSKFVFLQCLKLMIEILDNSGRHGMINPSIISTDSTVEPLNISIDISKYKRIQFYDRFEKEVFYELLNAINVHSPDKIRLHNFLLLTHFSVGLIYALGCVYKEVSLTSNGEIHLNYLKSTGRAFLNNVLVNRIEFTSLDPNRSVLSIVKVNLLRNNGFNDAITNYNNQLSLKYCKTLLDEC